MRGNPFFQPFFNDLGIVKVGDLVSKDLIFLKTSPRYPTAGLVIQFDVTDNSKWQSAVLNFGPLWRGISVGSDAL